MLRLKQRRGRAEEWAIDGFRSLRRSFPGAQLLLRPRAFDPVNVTR